MTKITIRLPQNLLRRFRRLASEMLCLPTDVSDGARTSFCAARAAHFHEALVYAAAEALRAYPEGATLDEPPSTLVPCLDVESAVPDEAADAVVQLARRSGLTLEQAWHRVVLEFCERTEAPGLGLHVAREAA